MNTQTMSKRLKISGVLNLLMGVGLALGALPALNMPAMLFVDTIIWPLDGAQDGLDPVARLLMAISGGLIAGLGAMWFAAAGRPTQEAPQTVRYLLMVGAIAWFVVDSCGSLLAAAPVNVLGNLLFLGLLLWPFWKTS